MAMYVCEEHEDSKVIYDIKNCPFCWAESKIHDLEQEAGGLQEEVQELKEQIEELTKEK